MNQIHVAYVLHRFPSLTETFVAEEIRSVRNLGATIHLYSLLPAKTDVVHPVSAELLPHVRYAPKIYAPSLWSAQLHFLFRKPRQYLRLLWSLLAEPVPEPNFVLKRLVIFAKGIWVARQLEGSPVQLVHTHFAWLSAAACMAITQLLDLPFSITAHAYDIYSHKNDLLALTTSMADRVVTISDYNKQAILERSPGLDPQRIEVIRCGIDLAQFQRSDGRPANQVFQITAVGSLFEKKGHEYLIRACSELKAQGLDFECVIVGQGSLEQPLRSLIRELDLDGQVMLAGGQKQTWVRDRLGTSDLFALACVVEGTGERDGIPVAIMEAMASGIPVVSTSVSGIAELVRHEETGLLVQPRDASALAAAILRLSRDDSLCRRLAASGRSLVEQEYDTHKNAARLVRIFRDMIEEHEQ
jgi:colanic acid/amylovoran biosynthesis glycosyltransferase